jgi:hypothetical protein
MIRLARTRKIILSLGLALLFAAALVSDVFALPPAYLLTPLDQPPNQSFVNTNDPMDLNENGAVVGTPSGMLFGVSTISRPVRWESPTADAAVLGGLSSGVAGIALPNSYASAVNNASVTVGSSTRFDDNLAYIGARAVYWLPDSTTPVELPPVPGRVDPQGNWSSGASYITDSGLIGGQSSNRPVIWNSLTSTPTELFSGNGSVASLNEARQAGGYIHVKPGSTTGFQPARWEADGSRTDLANLGISASGVPYGMALAINSAGDASGYSTAYDGAGKLIAERAVFWAAGQSGVSVLSLPAAGFDQFSNVRALDMNNSSAIVGSLVALPTGATNYEKYGVLWDGPQGNMVLIDNLLRDAPGWQIESALAINELGSIAAIAKGPDGRNAMVVLTPVPEPQTAVLLLVAAFAALAVFGKRSISS